MNSKKEVLGMSLLAISLAVGLGTVSYGLFSEVSPTKLKSVLDVFTQEGGIGINVSDGSFEPFDNVSISAYLTQGGTKLENRSVMFTIVKPDETEIVRTTMTDNLGFAETSLSLSEGQMTGGWHITANATVDNEAVSDALGFQCEARSAQIEVLSLRNGGPSDSFLPSDLVLLEAQLSYRNALIAGIPVTFDVRAPNGTGFLVKTATTNALARANITFYIPWPSDFSLGTWHVSATSELYGQSLKAEKDFECTLTPLVVDVFTQKGGVGPNTFGGYFVLNETVTLSATVRNGLNQTMPNQLIGFAVKDPNGTAFAYLVQTTDSSGMANITIRIPPVAAYLGTFEVYARAVYNDIVLIDTLTFIARQD
jgi:uncharacterized protein YfaS (alpha-2-macroglobulin family)